MGKLLKYLLWGFLAIVILLAIGVGILIYTVNPNEFKAPITKEVHELTGRTLQIKGDIGWTFFPSLGLSIHDVQLSNPEGFSTSKPFVSLKDADVSVKLLPLISGKVELGAIKLNGLQVNLDTNKDGKHNWENLVKKSPSKEVTIKTPTQTEKTSGEGKKMDLKTLDFSISSVAISNANVSYVDQQKQQSYQLQNFNLNSKNISLNSAFPITMNFSFRSKQPDIHGDASLDTKIAIDKDKGTLNVEPFVINAKVFGKDFPKTGLAINLKTDLALNQKAQTLSIKSLVGKIANMQFKASIDAIELFKNPTFNISVTIDQFNPTQFMQAIGVPAPKFTAKNAFQSLALTSSLIITPKAISVNKFMLNLDQSQVKGDAYLPLSKQEQTRFDVSLSKINLANYVPQTEHKKTTAPAKGQTSAAKQQSTQPQTLLPVKELRELNLDGKITIGQLTYDKLQAKNIKLNIVANNGIIKMINNSADIYQGKWLSNMALNVQSATPVLQVNEAINNVQLAPLTSALVDNSKLHITGTANIKTSLTTKGNSTQAMTKNLNGNGKFAFSDGEIKGVNVNYQLNRAVDLINKKQSEGKPKKDETPFTTLTGSIQIQNGVVNNNDLLLQSSLMTVTGKGYADLVNQKIDYQLDATAKENGIAAPVYALQQKIGGSIPLVLSGTFENYKVYPNINVILKNLATSYVKQNTDQIKEKVNKNLKNFGKQLQKGLKGLFN